jgi:hypothetical protein
MVPAISVGICSAAFAQNYSDSLFLPLTSEENRHWYDWHERELIRTGASAIEKFSRAPYVVSRNGLDSNQSLRWLNLNRQNILSKLNIQTEQRVERKFAPRSLESVGSEFSLTPMPSLSFHLAGSLDESRAKDPLYTGKKWRGLAGELSTAMVAYRSKHLNLWFGRFGSSWGDRRSLLLSYDVSLDGLEYALQWNRITLRYRLARLDGLNPDVDSVTEFSNRFLSGHRLEYRLNRHWQIAFGEMVVFGGPGRGVELGYLNPLLFYHGSQLNEDVNDNTLLFGEITAQPFPKSKMFTQLVIDDFQIDNEARGDKEPTQYAMRGIFDLVDMFQNTDLQIGYTRVSNWTYNQIDPRNRYSYLGKPIADVRGNDYDEASISVRHWFTPTSSLNASLIYRRQGEGRVNADWTEPWILSTGEYAEPFPTGVVETVLKPSLQFRGNLTRWLFLNAESGINFIQNERHLQDADANRLFLSFRLSIPIRLSIPVS